MENKIIDNPYIGALCRKGNKIILEKTPAGYCLSAWNEEGPCCRISGYASSEQGARLLVPDRVSEETLFCNGGKGCGLQPLDKNIGKTDVGNQEMVYYAVVETSAKLIAVPRKSIGEVVKGLPDSWTEDEIVEELLLSHYNAEKIVLGPEDFKGVEFHELNSETENEYSYLLERKNEAHVLAEL